MSFIGADKAIYEIEPINIVLNKDLMVGMYLQVDIPELGSVYLLHFG